MTKTLLLVHGMGDHKRWWSKDIVDKLDAAAEQYPSFNGKQKFHERTEIHEIVYDDVFSRLIDPWQCDAAQLDAWAKAAKRPLPTLTSWLRSPMPSEAKAFFWSTAIDALLYAGFRDVHDQVRDQVVEQIASIVTNARTSGSADITVLAHGMGAVVVHDALEQLGAGTKDFAALSAKQFTFGNLFMLADACLLARKVSPGFSYFDSVVRPATAGGAGETYCQYFINVWHRFDPLVLAGAFRPATWGANYIGIGPLDHVRCANVHGFAHYLDHPLVHAPVINAAVGADASGNLPISDADQRAALRAYAASAVTGCDAEIDAVKHAAVAVSSAGDFESAIIAIAEFFAVAKQAAESCPALSSNAMFV